MHALLSHPRRRMHPRFVMALALLAALSLWMSAATPAHAGYYPPAHSDAAYFHDSLAPYGTWTHHASYGAVWYPHGVAHGWRPYTHGRWVWDDGYGWTWASGFAWGWAPFHYGNWVWDAAFGWIWVPGRVWAPAWVTWRYSDSYIGWAPVGYGVSYWSYNPGWNHGGWNYVRRHHFSAPVVHQHIIVVNNYKTIYRNTHRWAPPRNKHNRVEHRGFDRSFVERGSRYKVDRVHARPEHWQRNERQDGPRLDLRQQVPEQRWRQRQAPPQQHVQQRQMRALQQPRQQQAQPQQHQRQVQEQQRRQQRAWDQQRQRQMQEPQRWQQQAYQQRQMPQQQWRQRQAQPQVRQTPERQRPPQQQVHQPQRQMQERRQAPPQMQRHAQQQQHAPQTQRRPERRYEQRTERRDQGDQRDGGRGWR
ncbi:MAG: DUF6600 domain-containing protein [Parvibaculum sp.]